MTPIASETMRKALGEAEVKVERKRAERRALLQPLSDETAEAVEGLSALYLSADAHFLNWLSKNPQERKEYEIPKMQLLVLQLRLPEQNQTFFTVAPFITSIKKNRYCALGDQEESYPAVKTDNGLGGETYQLTTKTHVSDKTTLLGHYYLSSPIILFPTAGLDQVTEMLAWFNDLGGVAGVRDEEGSYLGEMRGAVINLESMFADLHSLDKNISQIIRDTRGDCNLQEFAQRGKSVSALKTFLAELTKDLPQEGGEK